MDNLADAADRITLRMDVIVKLATLDGSCRASAVLHLRVCDSTTPQTIKDG